MTGGMPRRTLLGSTAAAGLAAALAGCSSDSGGGEGSAGSRRKGEKITLTFWTWVPGIDACVALWNKQNPDVQVKVEKVSPTNGAQYAKMHAALKAKNAPDLAQIEYQMVPSFLLDQGLVDLSKYGAGEHKDKFVGWQWQQSVFGDGVFAIPQDSGPMGMFYRSDLFDKWGIEPPATWAEYERAATKVRAKGAWIATFPPMAGGWFTGLAWQAGAHWFDTKGDTWIVDMTGQETRRVCDFWEGLVRGKLVKTEPDRQNAWYSDLQSGRIVTWVGAQWGNALLSGNAPGTAGKWRVAPMPQWDKGGKASANWGGSTTALMSGTKYPKDALAFAVWLNSAPESVALLPKAGVGWPAARAGSANPALDRPDDFFGGQKYNSVFAGTEQGVNTSWRWGPMMDATFQHLGDELTAAINGKGSFADALARVQRRTVDDLKAKGLKVETRT
ncbi:ABC transporter substrate-binding protein [Wenjunlia tyrosinilytica]|uniref:Sugar ABC transporter substrate-binding protein n=1 Tax=Wenjunlia tyrosinilytica TaxID=1544741 RepID=A0A917ZDV7_9ACTN|nr:extracellular solute-binding protein [Wenjunlia tyrosinilytica]GGO80027.1 sugar ABC transporter substrate-binding protein [Wenjunlia tyrosinilytica]